jgi:hypothetical protein
VAGDPDGDALTYSAFGLPSSLTMDAATGRISGTLTFGSAGTYLITIRASDGSDASSRVFTWTVTRTNRPPVLINPGAQVNGDNAAYAQAVLFDKPAAYWRLGEITFGPAADSAGTNHATRFGGVSLGEPGALASGNPAMRFDGSTGYLRVADAPSLRLTGDLTIEMWVNVPVGQRQTLVSKGLLNEYELTLEADGRLNLYQGDGTTYQSVLSAPGAIIANTWQHIVVTRAAATKTISFYVNGVAQGGGSYLAAPASSAAAVSIGRTDSGVQYVNGRLDEVAIYPAALTAAQVAAHYALRTSAGTDVSLQLSASDPDGDVLTYSASELPSTLAINPATGLITGTLLPSAANTYLVTVTASDGRLSHSQTFTWTVASPTAYDLSQPLSWNVAGANAYRLYAGTTLGGSDLADTGEILQTSYDASQVADLVGKTSVLWDAADASVAVRGYAMRLDGDRTDLGALPLAGCASGAGAPTCYQVSLPALAAGAHQIEVSAYNWAGEAVAAPVAVVESDHTIYLRLWSRIGGVWSSADTRFVAASLTSQFVYPMPGAVTADLSKPIAWTRIPGADAYSLSIGRSVGASDILNLPDLHQTSYNGLALPAEQALFARLGTRVRGVWRYRDTTFVAAAIVSHLTLPKDGALVATSETLWWSYVPGAEAYRLEVGTSVGATDVLISAEQPELYGVVSNLPAAKTFYARLWTKLNGTWRYVDSVFRTP